MRDDSDPPLCREASASQADSRRPRRRGVHRLLASLLLVIGCSSAGALVSVTESAHHGATAFQPAAEDAPVASSTVSSVARRRAVALRRRFHVWARRALGTGRARHVAVPVLLRPPFGPPALSGSTVLRL